MVVPSIAISCARVFVDVSEGKFKYVWSKPSKDLSALKGTDSNPQTEKFVWG